MAWLPINGLGIPAGIYYNWKNMMSSTKPLTKTQARLAAGLAIIGVLIINVLAPIAFLLSSLWEGMVTAWSDTCVYTKQSNGFLKTCWNQMKTGVVK